VICLNIDPPLFREVNPFDIAEKIADAQRDLYIDEIEKKGIKETLVKAINGDRRAVYKLVLWEKTAISLDLAVKQLAVAQIHGDKVFIENLANALKRKVYDKRKDRNAEYVKVLRYLVPFLKVKYNLTTRKVWKKINELGISDIIGVIFNDKDVSSLEDIDYFVKFLKRNHLSP
jgi:hypothetical protein